MNWMKNVCCEGRWAVLLAALVVSCGDEKTSEPSADAGPTPPSWSCESGGADAAIDYLQRLGCQGDFERLASQPLDESIPGARSVKVVLDQFDGDALYFQDSNKYQIHYEFASDHLSGQGLPIVPGLSDFNRTEYYAPDRRFILGAVTYYEGAGSWSLEISPYDTASAEMIAKLYDAVASATFFGDDLVFHPTSETVASEAKLLPTSVRVQTTDELFASIDYQPLNLGAAVGRLRFVKAEELEEVYLGFRDIVVLDHVPNDISVVTGLITEEFQTPLSHVNVLSQNRGTPNMGLRGATTNEELLALDGKWVRLEVGAFDYAVSEATVEEADAFWEEHKPEEVAVPRMDTSKQELTDILDVVVESEDEPLRDSIKDAIPAFGGKASHFSVLASVPEANAPKAFAIPVFFYDQFMTQNGFYDRVDAMLGDSDFIDDPAVRDEQLSQLRDDMMVAPVNQDLQDALQAKLEAEFSGLNVRFRSSTNAEDLDGFTGAGLYTSRTGRAGDWQDTLDAIREVWSSVWYFRAFEERSYRSIDHRNVGMALLVHHSFPNEEANGVALTANLFDPSGLEPGFYVNCQLGGVSVVQPPQGVTTDQFVYHYSMPGQPIVFLTHSNLVPEGESVLSVRQTHELGVALDAIHRRFSAAYGPAGGNTGWYAMDTEFKFDDDFDDDGELHLSVKQARPHPGRGQ